MDLVMGLLWLHTDIEWRKWFLLPGQRAPRFTNFDRLSGTPVFGPQPQYWGRQVWSSEAEYPIQIGGWNTGIGSDLVDGWSCGWRQLIKYFSRIRLRNIPPCPHHTYHLLVGVIHYSQTCSSPVLLPFLWVSPPADTLFWAIAKSWIRCCRAQARWNIWPRPLTIPFTLSDRNVYFLFTQVYSQYFTAAFTYTSNLTQL